MRRTYILSIAIFAMIFLAAVFRPAKEKLQHSLRKQVKHLCSYLASFPGGSLGTRLVATLSQLLLAFSS